MSYPEVSASEAAAKLAHYRIIDVREEHELHGPLGFIEGAELVPLSTVTRLADEAPAAGKRSEADSGAKNDAPRDGRPLLLVCRSGRRSGKACEILQQRGVEEVTNLAGGMIAWNHEGLPVRHNEPHSRSELVEQIASWAAQVGPLSSQAASDLARERIERHSVSFADPSHAAVDDLIRFFGESLESAGPSDLDLSLAYFRRALAVL